MDNFQENGKWVGMFRTGDLVRFNSHGTIVEAKVSVCFGYKIPGGYMYAVRWNEGCFAHAYEYQLDHVKIDEK